MTDAPDFNALAAETPFAADEWRQAWEWLDAFPAASRWQAWDMAVTLSGSWFASPVDSAQALVAAMGRTDGATERDYLANTIGPRDPLIHAQDVAEPGKYMRCRVLATSRPLKPTWLLLATFARLPRQTETPAEPVLAGQRGFSLCAPGKSRTCDLSLRRRTVVD